MAQEDKTPKTPQAQAMPVPQTEEQKVFAAIWAKVKATGIDDAGQKVYTVKSYEPAIGCSGKQIRARLRKNAAYNDGTYTKYYWHEKEAKAMLVWLLRQVASMSSGRAIVDRLPT